MEQVFCKACGEVFEVDPEDFFDGEPDCEECVCPVCDNAGVIEANDNGYELFPYTESEDCMVEETPTSPTPPPPALLSEKEEKARAFCNSTGHNGCAGCPMENEPVCPDCKDYRLNKVKAPIYGSNAKGVENTAATPQGGLHMNKAIEKVHGNQFAITSIGVALNVGNGDYKALVDGKIKTSRTVLPVDNAFYMVQVPSTTVAPGDFMMVDGTPMVVRKAEDAELLVVNIATGEQKVIIPEETPDGLKFVQVIRTSIPAAIITKLVNGTLSTAQMLLVSGDKSLDQIMAMKLVAENDDLTADDLALFQQARRDM